MNLILIEPAEVDAAGVVTLAGPRAAHLTAVLRVTPGQPVRIGIVDGPAGSGIVTDVHPGAVRLTCSFTGAVPPRPPVDLLLAVPRPKVLRRLWAQLAALGVGRVLLTNAAKVERHYFDTHILDEATYRPLLIEGLQQARDTRLPVVSIHRQFRPLVEDHLHACSDAATRVVADPSALQPLRAVIATATPRTDAATSEGRVLLAIGPEGGWNAFELELLAAHGFVAAAMGGRTLRSDTAAIALLTLVHDAMSER